jgi:hypothetical protein
MAFFATAIDCLHFTYIDTHIRQDSCVIPFSIIDSTIYIIPLAMIVSL